MSCRVLQRGVEKLLCNYTVEQARQMGMSTLHGVYIPTPKNGMVRDHYASLGFQEVDRKPDGTTHWRLDLEDYTAFDVAIETVEEI
jgi:predicted enzyme involved in methoxymalonyl-ACP biosynthesis